MASLSHIAVLGLALICYPDLISAISNVNIKEINCDYNKARATNVTCKILDQAPRKHLDFSSTLLSEVKDVIAHVEILKNTPTRTIPLVNITEDFCTFMSGSSSSFYLDLLMKMLRDQSNINHPCPYSGYIYATGINPDPKLIPDGIPPGDYSINIGLYESKMDNFLGSVKVNLQFI